MADMQSAAAEIRRGKKQIEDRRKKKERRPNDRMKIYWSALFHR